MRNAGNRHRGESMRVSPVTIAVLPFGHLGGDCEREYLTDGLTEEMSASPGQIDPERLSVKGRTSTKAYKGTRKSPAVIGQELGVQYLVDGSVRTESRRLRVTAKLIRAHDERQVWADSYEDEPSSVLELQQTVSLTIAREIQLHLSPDRVTAPARRHSRNNEAVTLCLRGRYLWNQLTPATNKLAIESYVRATELDPQYALAWAGVADIYSSMSINSDARPKEVSTHARTAAERAVASGPDLAETQTALGTVHFWLDWDWPAAEWPINKPSRWTPAIRRRTVCCPAGSIQQADMRGMRLGPRMEWKQPATSLPRSSF